MNNQPPSNSQPPLPDWMSGSDVPVRSPSKSPTNTKILLIFSGLFLALILVGAVVFALQNRTNCLTIDDYLELSDENYHDKETFDPKEDFYMTTFAFVSGSKNLDADQVEPSKNEIAKLAQFYKDHHQKPMVFKVTVLYNQSLDATDDPKILANQRVEAIKHMLTEAGVPSVSITSSPVAYSVSGDEERPDDDNLATLSLISSDTCK